MITLKGLTWNHTRGVAGLIAASKRIEQKMEAVRVVWDTHSLADFSANPIGETIGNYDFVIYDHPFVGDVSKDGVMIDLTQHCGADFIDELSLDAVGHGVDIYRYDGGLWALPVDAACQVSAFRPDLCARTGLTAATLRQMTLPEIIAGLGEANLKLAISFSGVGSLMTFFTICHKLGAPPFADGRLVDPAAGRAAIAVMRAILAASPVEVLDWDSIACLEAMARRDDLAFCPYIFGFSPYSMEPFSHADGRRPIAFNASPSPDGPRRPGGIIGGAGIGISSRTRHPGVAVAFVQELMGRQAHLTIAAHLSQPGRRSTWVDPETNRASLDFYSNTLEDIDQGYIRPRVPGFVAKQDAGGICLERHLRQESNPDAVLADLEAIFAA